MKYLVMVLVLLLLPFGVSLEAAQDESKYEARFSANCIEPSAVYLDSSSDENKARLAACLLLEKDNVSPDACIDNVSIYLEEKSVTTQKALIDCLSIRMQKWNEPFHYRANEYNFPRWHERVLDRYPGKV